MAVKKTAATKKESAPKADIPTQKMISKASKPVAKKKTAKKAAEKKTETFDIEVEANAAMGAIVVEALKSEQFTVATEEMKAFFSKEDISDIDIQSLLCKIFAQGVIAGAAIAADEAQKGFEDVNNLLQKLTKK